MIAMQDAIRGALLGGAVGDALGAPVEFLSLSAIHELHGANGVTGYVEFGGQGAITDDTQMTLFTAEGILRAHAQKLKNGVWQPLDAMRSAYLRWLQTQGGSIPENISAEELHSGWLIGEKQLFACRAPGMTCLSALEHSLAPGKAHNHSKGCGTVMRMAPVGLFFPPRAAYEYGCQFSALTHGHPTGIIAGGALAMLIAELLAGQTLTEALNAVLAHLAAQPDAEETIAALQKAQRAQHIAELGEGWIAEEALAIGVYCALQHTHDFPAGVLAAVNISGDSDSTGAIAGNILGVINGESAIPAAWLAQLREVKIVSAMADELWQCLADKTAAQSALDFSPEYESAKRKLTELHRQYAAQLAEYDHLLSVVRPSLEADYMLKIGRREYQIFSLQVQIQQLKREIALYQAARNQGQSISTAAVQAIIDAEFAEYKAKLQAQQEKITFAENLARSEKLAANDAKALKELYHDLVLHLHPDLHPDLPPEARKLWQKIVEAYQNWDWQELNILADMAYALLDNQKIRLTAENSLEAVLKAQEKIEKKIAALATARSAAMARPPLCYLKLLNNAAALQAKQQELDGIRAQYEEHLEFLTAVRNEARGNA